MRRIDPMDAVIGDLMLNDDGTPTGLQVTVISNGAPCKCGPGFCAANRGLGYYGYCRGPAAPKDVEAGAEAGAELPPCPHCSAPHQGPNGCWFCSVRGGNNTDHAEFWLRCLSEGVAGHEVFDMQRDLWQTTGEFSSLDEVLDRVLAAQRTQPCRK